MVPGKVGVATGGMVQQDLFGDRCEYGDRGERPAEPVLMALHAEYYELIWRGSSFPPGSSHSARSFSSSSTFPAWTATPLTDTGNVRVAGTTGPGTGPA